MRAAVFLAAPLPMLSACDREPEPDSAEGAVLLIKAQGLPPGEHGVRIHSGGRCEPPDFESARPHWSPENRQGAALGEPGQLE